MGPDHDKKVEESKVQYVDEELVIRHRSFSPRTSDVDDADGLVGGTSEELDDQSSVPLIHIESSLASRDPPENGATKLSDAGVKRTRTRSSIQVGLLKWYTALNESFGCHLLLLVSSVYFTQGFRIFSLLAMSFFMKDELALQPAESQFLKSLTGMPWVMKPIFGILSDSFPIRGRRRKPYLIGMGLLGAVSFLCLGNDKLVISSETTALSLLSVNLSFAFVDVVVDALVVEEARNEVVERAGDLQSLSWAMMAFGSLVGSAVSGPAISGLGVRTVFGLSTGGPLAVAVISCFLTERRVGNIEQGCLSSMKRQSRSLCAAMRNPLVWRPTLWIFVAGAAAPSFGDIFFFFQTEELGFDAEFLSLVNIIGSASLIVGTVLYNVYFRSWPFRKILGRAQVALAIVSSLDLLLVTRVNLTLGIPDRAFVFGDEIISEIVGRLSTMPLLVLSARLCPPGVEGTLFALLMSISNFSQRFSAVWGAGLASCLGVGIDNYGLLWVAVSLRTLLRLLPLLFLSLLPSADPQTSAHDSTLEYRPDPGKGIRAAEDPEEGVTTKADEGTSAKISHTIQI